MYELSFPPPRVTRARGGGVPSCPGCACFVHVTAETYRIQALPGEIDIFDRRASAVKVLRSRGSVRRPPPGASVTGDGAESMAGAAVGMQGGLKGREQGRRRRPSALLSEVGDQTSRTPLTVIKLTVGQRPPV